MLKKILVVSAIVLMMAVLVVPLVAEAGGPSGRGGRGHGISHDSGLNFVDEDGDGICDNARLNFIDEDGDGISDNIGAGIQRSLGERLDLRW